MLERLAAAAAANTLILDIIAFKIIQEAAKHFVMGVVTWQLLERQCVRLGCIGGKLAAGAAQKCYLVT